MASDIFECAEKLESRLTNLVLSGSFSNGPGISLNIVEYTSACTSVVFLFSFHRRLPFLILIFAFI